MDLVIKENAYTKVGISFEELCYLLSLQNKISKQQFQRLREERYILIDQKGQINIGGKGHNAIIESMRLSSIVKTDYEEIEALAKAMADLFPKGKKPGTNKYWKGNSALVVKKLINFLKRYGIFPSETILKATSAYINSFGQDTSLMRILPYFIEKDGESDLLTFIENLSEESIEKSDFEDETLLWAYLREYMKTF